MMKQYFSIQSSKRLFMTDQDGILESDQLLGRECISHNGLTPLLVMAVADARLKLRRCCLTSRYRRPLSSPSFGP